MRIPIIVSVIAGSLVEKFQCGPASYKTDAICKYDPAWGVSVINHASGPLTEIHLGRSVRSLR